MQKQRQKRHWEALALHSCSYRIRTAACEQTSVRWSLAGGVMRPPTLHDMSSQLPRCGLFFDMASKRKSPPTKLRELVDLVPLCESGGLIEQEVDVDHHDIPTKRKCSADEESSLPSPGLNHNNNNNSINNNNLHSKRSMDHVLKRLTFKMMRDEAVVGDHHISAGCPPEEPADDSAASIQLRGEHQLAVMLRQLQ
ncbi:hypothetical protein FOCC_FOCC003732, partial [Frankliniella occidentalis]